ncbi:hypothetical protein QYE76_030975 [Lolium multiflorum]|uniref:Transposase-associated domain-containing protein n=1 Tax=Lolium multiflorum TaxID=4521 RepID=A0AAD8QT81_LOLMU|nr:hypothetical protein QYE76_030975 [Lolium multiflorum]
MMSEGVVARFLKAATAEMIRNNQKEIRCPCRRCKLTSLMDPKDDMVRDHLLMRGFMDGYRWEGDEDDYEFVHGISTRNKEGGDQDVEDLGHDQDVEDPGDDHDHNVGDPGPDDGEDQDGGHHEDEDDGPSSMDWVQDPYLQELLLKQTSNARAAAREKAKMDQLEVDAVTPLYEGCRPEDTRLKVTLMALEMKVKHKMTDTSFNDNMSFWHERLPKGTTLSTSAALDSPSVIDKLVSPPHASRAGTSAESENSHNIDNVSAVLDDSGSLGSFLDATIAKSRQIEKLKLLICYTFNSPESVEYSSDDLDEDYVELDDDFIEKCNATTDARKIKKLLAEHAVRYKLSPDPKFATSPINIRDKDYDFSLDLSHIAIVEKTPFCGTEKESAVEHMTELSTLSGLFSDDIKMRTYFVAKIFPFSLKDDAKTWYNNLPPGSIKSPKELLDVFFRKYFPASAQHAALQRIYNFDQEDGEKLPEAWARFCSLIRAQPDHDLEKHDLLDIFYSGLTIESRAYLDSCAGCVFRKRTPDDAEELLAKIGRNHDDWSTPEPTPTPIVKKRGMIKLNDEDMREAKKSLKEKGIKPEDVKNLPPIEDICETIPPSSTIELTRSNNEAQQGEDDHLATAMDPWSRVNYSLITPEAIMAMKSPREMNPLSGRVPEAISRIPRDGIRGGVSRFSVSWLSGGFATGALSRRKVSEGHTRGPGGARGQDLGSRPPPGCLVAPLR